MRERAGEVNSITKGEASRSIIKECRSLNKEGLGYANWSGSVKIVIRIRNG
jgi:hypothetical protein